MQTEEKTVKVLNKYDLELHPCTEKTAYKLIRGQRAYWIDDGVIKLLVDDDDRKKLRKKVINKANRICYICDRFIGDNDTPTIDHVVPKFSGPDNETNWKCCCRECNMDKGNRSLSQYIYHIRQNRDNYDILSDEKLNQLEALANKIEGDIFDRYSWSNVKPNYRVCRTSCSQ